MAPFKVSLTLFSLMTFALLISGESLAQNQCLCEFERRDHGENYTTVNIFVADQKSYGLLESLRYKVLRDDTSNANAYSIEVMLDQKTYRYEVDDLQIFFEENRIGSMSNLQVGLSRIVSHLLPESCESASQMHPRLKEVLFNTSR